jgi:hypothetical protein
MKNEIRVCFWRYCIENGIENAGGVVYDLKDKSIDFIKNSLISAGNWIIVDENFKQNIILSHDDEFNPEKINNYFLEDNNKNNWHRKLFDK